MGNSQPKRNKSHKGIQISASEINFPDAPDLPAHPRSLQTSHLMRQRPQSHQVRIQVPRLIRRAPRRSLPIPPPPFEYAQPDTNLPLPSPMNPNFSPITPRTKSVEIRVLKKKGFVVEYHKLRSILTKECYLVSVLGKGMEVKFNKKALIEQFYANFSFSSLLCIEVHILSIFRSFKRIFVSLSCL